MLQLELLYMNMSYQVSGFYPLPRLFLKTAGIDLASWLEMGWVKHQLLPCAITAGFLLG